MARFVLVAILTLAVPTHAVAVMAVELCLGFGDPGASGAAAHDHAAHDHADHGAHADNESDAVHCPPCATAFIPGALKLAVPVLRQAGVVILLVYSRDSALSRGLDRPPLAL